MLKTERKMIGEYEYAVTQLDAVKGSRVFTRLTKILAPAIVGLSSASTQIKGTKPADVDDVTGSKMFEALGKLAENLTEADVDFFRECFAASTDVMITDEQTGKQRSPKLSTIFGLHFAGKYDEMIEWLVFCFEVNFGSFFVQIGLRAQGSRAATEPSK